MKRMQMVFLLLFSLPVIAAQYFSLDQSLASYISVLTSLGLLIICLGLVLGSLQKGKVRTSVGLAILSTMALYFYAQFLSYYLQGSYFNQQFYFHLNFVTLVASWSVYYPLVFLFIGWLLCILLSFLYFRNRLLGSRLSFSTLAALLILATIFDPGVMKSVKASFSARFPIGVVSLDSIDWEQLKLDQGAIQNSNVLASPGKNLVLVFLEGLEKIYTDDSLFPGLTPNLHRLNEEGWQLESLSQVQGSSWTMGGMVSSLCGTPLVYESSFGGNQIMFTRFLDNATCLSDVLNKADYQQVFMGGADLNFAGKGEFLRTHNFDSVLGRAELISELDDPTYLGGWGLFDDSLFSLAIGQFERLAAEKEPFNLTVLTVDTHHPDGEPSSSCSPYGAIDNSILHAVHCTDYLVGKFIGQLKEHPAYKDTVVVLVSDHLALRNNAFSMFPRNYQRQLYFNVLNIDLQAPLKLSGTPMDLAPTILGLLGVNHSASFLVGTNLLSDGQEEVEGSLRLSRRLQAIRFINSNYLSSKGDKILYSLNQSRLRDLDFSGHVKDPVISRGRLEFTSIGNDPYFILPSISIDSQEDAQLYITFEAEKASSIELFFTTEENRSYSEENKQSKATTSGKNMAIFPITKSAAEGRLRIDPGANPGRFLINSIDIH